MNDIKKLSDEFSAGGQPTAEDLKHLVKLGINLDQSHIRQFLTDLP